MKRIDDKLVKKLKDVVQEIVQKKKKEKSKNALGQMLSIETAFV